jgi:hypothetical protein
MDIDIEISNLGLEHINKIYYIEGDCLFDTIAHLLKYLKNEKNGKKCYIYNSSLEILMALSLKNSNLSVEEPKFYIMKNFAFSKHNPKTSPLQEPESCCKYFVHMLYICRQTYKR